VFYIPLQIKANIYAIKTKICTKIFNKRNEIVDLLILFCLRQNGLTNQLTNIMKNEKSISLSEIYYSDLTNSINFFPKIIKKKLILLILFTTLFIWGYSQTSILESSNVTYQQLNSEQKSRFDTYALNLALSNFKIITVKPLSEVIDNGNIHISLGEYLPCSLLTFSTDFNDYTSNNEYSWSGSIHNDNAEDCDFGQLNLVSNQGSMIGHLSIYNSSYEIYDLTSGLQVIVKSEKQGQLCGTGNPPAYNIPSPPNSHPSDCINNHTRILIFFTPAALAKNPNLNDIAWLSMLQLNTSFQNSSIDENAKLVGILPLNFTESNNLPNDKNRFKIDASVQAERINLKADICVLFVDDLDPSVLGIVDDINATFNSAFSVVQVKFATTNELTFAHEITHFYGGRHENDPDPGNNNAFSFKKNLKVVNTLMI
jgi:hypothetical protein